MKGKMYSRKELEIIRKRYRKTIAEQKERFQKETESLELRLGIAIRSRNGFEFECTQLAAQLMRKGVTNATNQK